MQLSRQLWMAGSAAAAIAGSLLVPGEATANPFYSGWQVAQVPLQAVEGGRPTAIASDPSNDNFLIVAGQLGGLFRSIDRGKHWKHIDSLPTLQINSVAILPNAPSVVIATAQEDGWHTGDVGGVWVSRDKGTTWQRAGLMDFAMPRISGYGISVAPDTGQIFVSTNRGVFSSSDLAVTWTNLGNPYDLKFGSTAAELPDVLALPNGRLLVATAMGVAYRDTSQASWNWPSGPEIIPASTIHGLERDPFSPLRAYVVDGNDSLWVTENGGQSWIKLQTQGDGESGGGLGFVRAQRVEVSVGPASTLTRKYVRLYFSNRQLAYSKLVPIPSDGSRPEFDGVLWTDVDFGHADPRDLEFDHSGVPYIAGTDGGIHGSTDGETWSYTGSGLGGYHALLIADMNAQYLSDRFDYSIYIGLQDNGAKVFGIDGSLKPDSFVGDVLYVSSLPKSVASASQILVRLCGKCANVTSGAHLKNWKWWAGPVGSDQDRPVAVAPNFVLQGVDSLPGNTWQSGLAFTPDGGLSWKQFVQFDDERTGTVQTSGIATPPAQQSGFVAYQAIRAPNAGSEPAQSLHLARIVSFGGLNLPYVTFPQMAGFGSLGIRSAGFGIDFSVFAVDPFDFNHLIAADVTNQGMMESHDGGNSWSAMMALNSLITDGGKWRFTYSRDYSQAAVVKFHPSIPNIIAVGTARSGVKITMDGGGSWTHVPGSEAIPNMTALAWRAWTQLFIASYGRSLWLADWRVTFPFGKIKELCREICRFRPADRINLATLPASTRAILVADGYILGCDVTKGRVRKVYVSPGASVGAFGPQAENVEVAELRSKKANRCANDREKANAKTAGLLLSTGNGLAGFIDARVALSSAIRSMPVTADAVKGFSTESPAGRVPYIRITGLDGGQRDGLRPGQVAQIQGKRFEYGKDYVVSLDGVRVARLTADRARQFAWTFRVPATVGRHYLTVRDARTDSVLDGSRFNVVRGGDLDAREQPR